MDKKTMIENLIREAHEKGGYTGTWLYAEKGEIVSKGAIGINDIEKETPVTEDTVFDLASVTKQFTAAAVMLLREGTVLTLEEQKEMYTPALLPNGEPALDDDLIGPACYGWYTCKKQ